MRKRRTRFLHLISLLAMLAPAAPLAAQASDDGRRTVDVKPYGVSVRAPAAWRLVDRARGARAFVLQLPQEANSPAGYAACELGLAPENLDEYQRRHRAADEREQSKDDPTRTLIRCEIEPIDAEAYGEQFAEKIGRRLTSVWRHDDAQTGRWYEMRVHLIVDDMLYTFLLTSDEAHYEAYRIDFEALLASARFSEPETGLQRMPGGYWMQRQFRFALKLPEDWKPAFGPDDRVLFFATGTTHEVFTDNLLVLAAPNRPLDLESLRDELSTEITRQDPAAEVARCEIIPQGAGQALETVIHTRRGPFEITVIERRFRGAKRNYEMKFTCQTATFQKQAAAFRTAFDSFQEVEEARGQEAL